MSAVVRGVTCLVFKSSRAIEVDAWDVNPHSLQKLQEVIAAEGIEHIDVQQRDLKC